MNIFTQYFNFMGATPGGFGDFVHVLLRLPARSSWIRNRWVLWVLGLMFCSNCVLQVSTVTHHTGYGAACVWMQWASLLFCSASHRDEIDLHRSEQNYSNHVNIYAVGWLGRVWLWSQRDFWGWDQLRPSSVVGIPRSGLLCTVMPRESTWWCLLISAMSDCANVPVACILN